MTQIFKPLEKTFINKYISLQNVEIVFRKRIWPKTEPLQLDLDLIYRKYQMQ